MRKKLIIAASLATATAGCGALKKKVENNEETTASGGPAGQSGTNGTPGETGPQGPAGSQGAPGARGPAGAWEVYALTTGKRVGTLMGGYNANLGHYEGHLRVLLDDGSQINLLVTDGTLEPNYIHAAIMTHTGNNSKSLANQEACRFTTTDCSGSCYYSSSGPYLLQPYPNLLIKIGGQWYKGTGTEQDAGSLQLRSQRRFGDSGSCNTSGFPQNFDHNFPLTPYTPPADFDYPFGGLDIRPNTQ
ncbi:MAG: hypothetical protein RIR26_655 [Pseudomonadota bacterium]